MQCSSRRYQSITDSRPGGRGRTHGSAVGREPETRPKRRQWGASSPLLLLLALHLALSIALVAPRHALAQSTPTVEGDLVFGRVKAQGRSMPYVVYLPPNYSPEKEWPVILFLHGAGEGGGDGLKQVGVGIGPQLRLRPERFPCLVVMPQTYTGSWSLLSGNLALQAMDEVVEKYHGDRNRLYLTGLSLGGNGTWVLASAYPERFAAILPICGWGNPAAMAPKLASLPIWVFHGAADSTVSVQNSRAMVAAIQAAGSTTLRYTEYPGAGHDIWDRTYGNPEVIAWLLAQKR
jgi:predicted peptidase